MKKLVNLLPPAAQKLNKQVQINRELMNFGVWLVLSLIVVALVLLAAQITLQAQLSGAREQIQLKTAELSNLEQAFLQDEVIALNQDMDNLEKIREHNKEWSGALLEIARLLPSDMVLDSMVVDGEDNRVEARGRSRTRDSVLEFRKNLLSSEYFQNVNFPLANLEKATETEWSYRFFIDQEKL